MASTTAAGLSETSDVLAHPIRSHVLHYLRTHSEVVAIDTLTAVLTNELAGPSATAGGETPEQIEVALQHTHLPKLADAGLITYEDNPGEIALTDDTDSLDPSRVTPLSGRPLNSETTTQANTRPENAMPSKMTLFCPTCDHQSHVNGDWRIVRTPWTYRYLCPTCHTQITARPCHTALTARPVGQVQIGRRASRIWPLCYEMGRDLSAERSQES